MSYVLANNFIILFRRKFFSKYYSSAARDRLGIWGTGTDRNVIPGSLSGLDRLKQNRFNKGLTFTLKERQVLGIHGHLPPAVRTLPEEIKRAVLQIDRLKDNYDKYIYLNNLAERNEHLYFNVLASDVRKFMPLVYTPTIGLVCQKFSLLYESPRGLFITIKDKGHVYSILKNWPGNDVRAIVVTDGERILGLGDLGANGMGIPIGKMALYTALGGVPPHYCLPVTLDCGTNTQTILDDPVYLGLRQKRVTGKEYDDFVDEFVQAVVRRYGQNCIIQFEDFGNANAFRLLEKYRDTNCVFNDDIQGTAAVLVAGILSSLRIKKTSLKNNRILFYGAGEAGLGTAMLCQLAMQKEGLTEKEAKSHLWLFDSKGLIIKNRPAGGLTEHKLRFAQDHAPINDLLEAVSTIKPSILIGSAAIGGSFTREILEKMAEINDMPVIFALSNPTIKSECTAEEAYIHTKGKCIFASGSPFPAVTYDGKTYQTGQANNAYTFPGVALGIICAGMLHVPEEVFLICAEKLASLATDEDRERGNLYPPLSKISEWSLEMAVAVMEYAYQSGLASICPEPTDKYAFIRSQRYKLDYESPIPDVYNWK